MFTKSVIHPEKQVFKFGYNPDSDSGDDVWDGSNAYPFPSAAAATTLVSTDAADDAAGTGAQTVKVQGLDSNWLEIEETVTMDGLTPVNLSAQFLRVNRMQVLTAGSGEVNAGNIQCSVGGTVVSQITAGYGQTLQAIYSSPDHQYTFLFGWKASCDASGAAVIALQARTDGGAWLTKDIFVLDGTGKSGDEKAFDGAQRFAGKTDFRVRVLTGGNNMKCSSNMDLYCQGSPTLPS